MAMADQMPNCVCVRCSAAPMIGKTNSAIDGRTTRHAGYAISQQKRKLVEQVFGWMKTVGGLRKLRHRGGELVDWIVTFTAAAYNLVRTMTDGVGVGPILMGLGRSAHVLTPSATVRRVVNMTAIASVDAQIRAARGY